MLEEKLDEKDDTSINLVIETKHEDIAFTSKIVMKGADHTWLEVLENVIIALRGQGYCIPAEFDDYMDAYSIERRFL